MSGQGESATSPRRLAAVDKQAQALELRKAGVSFDAIAAALGYRGKSGARQAVMGAIQKILREPVEEFVALELARLDDMGFALWPAVRRGEEKAIARMLDVMVRRAKLIGLDAPTKLAVELPPAPQARPDDGFRTLVLGDSAIRELAQSLFARMGERDALRLGEVREPVNVDTVAAPDAGQRRPAPHRKR